MEDNQWISRQAVSKMLGISHQTVWNMANKGIIRIKSHGIRHCLYSKEDAQKILERNDSHERPQRPNTHD